MCESSAAGGGSLTPRAACRGSSFSDLGSVARRGVPCRRVGGTTVSRGAREWLRSGHPAPDRSDRTRPRSPLGRGEGTPTAPIAHIANAWAPRRDTRVRPRAHAARRAPWRVAADSSDGELRPIGRPGPERLLHHGHEDRVPGAVAEPPRAARGQRTRTCLPGAPPVAERNRRLVPMMRGLAHMDETPARPGATARRDVLGGAPPRDPLVIVARFIRRGDGAAE